MIMIDIFGDVDVTSILAKTEEHIQDVVRRDYDWCVGTPTSPIPGTLFISPGNITAYCGAKGYCKLNINWEEYQNDYRVK